MVKLDYARLKNIRLEQDITQKELATATGVNLSTIKQIETGRSATDLENIEKLCAYLEVDINEIYHPDFHDTKAVSYTHLDVYKRQGYRWVSGAGDAQGGNI